MPYLLDTNIFIDYFLQNQNAKLAEKLLNHYFFTNKAVYYEIANFFNNKIGAKKTLFILNQFQEWFNSFEFLEITEEIEQKAILIMTKYSDQNLSLVDCILIAQAKEFNLELKTLDQKMTFCKEANITKPY
jgi:predicted nucleic acid-binding protein